MRQLLQNLKNGSLHLEEVPQPLVPPGHVLIRTAFSVISSGTERAIVEFGRAGWLAKARQQPEKVKQVWDKLRADGIAATFEAVKSRLDMATPLGYCNAGVVMDIGSGVTEFSVGDCVISNGNHAEVVCVPKNLCARIPDTVRLEDAALTVLGAVGLHGLRLAEPTLGETMVVMGLGLVGQIVLQLAECNGCRVIGLDPSEERVAAARELVRLPTTTVVSMAGDVDAVEQALRCNDGLEIDAVLITAATASNEPIHQAAQMCRKRGRIVLVGVAGLELRRSDFYEKELSFRVSCSYGPGRYDPSYEYDGHDYPISYVRWTEQRNFTAILNLMATGRLAVKPLVTHRFSFDRAVEAYDLLVDGRDGALGILLDYGNSPKERRRLDAESEAGSSRPGVRAASPHVVVRDGPEPALDTAGAPPCDGPRPTNVGVIGAGNFTQRVLLPALAKASCKIRAVASARGLSGSHLARRFGIPVSTTDHREVINDANIEAVVISTRHHQHAPMVIEALEAGKHVFVEKPLALSREDVDRISTAWHAAGADRRVLQVGFNRRFAPLVKKLSDALQARRAPLSVVYTVNAGAVPSDHWVQDPEIGGGRIVGEACHFVDLIHFLARSEIVKVTAQAARSPENDIATIVIALADGSMGTVHYFANGHRAYPKERIEVFSEERVFVLDNFRRLTAHGSSTLKKASQWRQDKGHVAQMAAFVRAVARQGPPPIPFSSLSNVSLASIAAAESMAKSPGESVADIAVGSPTALPTP